MPARATTSDHPTERTDDHPERRASTPIMFTAKAFQTMTLADDTGSRPETSNGTDSPKNGEGWLAALRARLGLGTAPTLRDTIEEALKGDDVELIRSRMNALQEAAYKLSEAAYQAAQASAGAGGPSGDGAAGPEEEVVEEAEYEVIDEDK